MKTLIIVDFQKDFINGSLAVNGSDNVEDAIAKFIINNHNELNEIIFTIDWHTRNHCSFKNNGGIWPNHCVQYTEGAGISDKLMNICIDYNIPTKIFIKGNTDDIEEYGAFEKIGTWTYENGSLDIIANNYKNDSPIHIVTSDVIVAGIAGDYCVMNTIKNLMKYHGPLDLNISVFKDGIANIDDGTTLDNFIKENNLKTI